MDSDVSDASFTKSDHSRDLSDISDAEIDDSILDDLNEFEREKILAERHAKSIRRKQLRQFLDTEKPEEESPSDDKSPTSLKKSLTSASKKSRALFIDDKLNRITSLDENELNLRRAQASNLLSIKLIQTARLSRKRLLHILEHPRRMDYLVGSIIKVHVSLSNNVLASNTTFSAHPIATILPELVNTHVICQIVTLNECDQYNVLELEGCDHEPEGSSNTNFIGSTKYVTQCIVLDDPDKNKEIASLTQAQVSLNDVCDSPLTEAEFEKIKEFVVKSSPVQAWFDKHNKTIKRLKEFTFTDDDVQYILKNKSTSLRGYNKKELIREIQACSNELDIISSSLRKIANLSKREQDQLQTKFNNLTSRKNELQAILSNSRKEFENHENQRNSLDSRQKKVNKVYTFGIGGSIANRKTAMPTPMVLTAAMSSMSTSPRNSESEKNQHLNKNTEVFVLNYNIKESGNIVDSYLEALNSLKANDVYDDSNFIVPDGFKSFNDYKNNLR